MTAGRIFHRPILVFIALLPGPPRHWQPVFVSFTAFDLTDSDKKISSKKHTAVCIGKKTKFNLSQPPLPSRERSLTQVLIWAYVANDRLKSGNK